VFTQKYYKQILSFFNMDDFFKDINFPYSSLRLGQDKFILDVFKTISAKKNILISAPTGLGKTVSEISPALHFAKQNNLTIIYLTSRQTQANQVIKTIKDINNFGSNKIIGQSLDKSKDSINQKSKTTISYVGFIGKRSMCVHDERDLYPASDFNDFCKKMKEKGKCKYFKNVKDSDNEDKIKAILDESSNSFMDVEGFINISHASQFCPYEVAGLKAFKTDVIICDYNYLFATGIKENFLGKIGRVIEECIVVVDEAHNLPDRVRSAYSYSLNSQMISDALKEMGDFVKTSEYDNYIYCVRDTLEETGHKSLGDGNNEATTSKEKFMDLYLSKVGQLVGNSEIIEKLKDIERLVKEDRVVSHIGRLANFLDRFKELDEENFIRQVVREKKKGVDSLSLKIRCIDPSNLASDIVNHTYSTILMSGTLSPIEMYRDILGVGNASLLELESPFANKNQKMIVLEDVTTKYSARSSDMFKKISTHIENCLNGASDQNSIVFFPSYDLMDRIIENMNMSRLFRKVLREQRYMTKEEKEAFVDKFKSKGTFDDKAKVLFAVTSGSFAEGLDLPEDMLEMVIVVGLPLGVPDLYTNAVIRHYDKKFRKGQLYGYIYPAMTKIIQAAGRCIRTEEDRGVVVLMDNRFLWPLYAQAFPKHWKFDRTKEYKLMIGNFFDK
jgi:DNA excision repair protein ERCC-2